MDRHALERALSRGRRTAPGTGKAAPAAPRPCLARCLVALPVTAIALLATAHGASAATGGLGVAPGSSDRAYITAILSPGGGGRDAIRVSNSSATSLTVQIGAVDGLTAPTSGAVYGSAERAPQKWGTWIVPDRSGLTLPPHSETQVGFAIQVPGGATPGDHLAGVAVESTATSGDGSGTTVVTRAVVGVLVQVPGAAAFHLAIGTAYVGPVSTFDHTNMVWVPLTDDGLLLGKPDISVTLKGPSGYQATATRQLDTMLPGDTIAYEFAWPDVLPAGAYEIQVHPIDLGTPAAPGAQQRPPVTPRGPAAPVGPITLVPGDQIQPSRQPVPPPSATSFNPIPLQPGSVTVAPAVSPPLGQILQSVAATSSFPLALLVLVGLFLLVQNRIDRRDPKLALAPAFADEDLLFQPLPRAARGGGGEAAPSAAGHADGDGSKEL